MLAPYAEFKEDSELFALAREGLEYFESFLSHFGLNDSSQGPELLNTGMLVPAVGLHKERAERILETSSKYVKVEKLTAEDIKQEDPNVSLPGSGECYRVPGCVIDPRKLHKALTRKAQDSSIEIYNDRVKRVSYSEDGCELSTESKREIKSEHLVVAIGAWSRAVGDLVGLELDVVPVKGQVARFQVPDGTLHHVVHTHEVYLAPRPGAGIIIGATVEDVGFNDEIVNEEINKLHQSAQAFMPSLAELSASETWCGFRPKLPDGYPALGCSPSNPNLWLATGHYRNGILLSAISGKIMAEKIVSGSSSSYSAFNPARLF